MINKCILIGNLGKDPEIKYLEGNIAVCKFSVATNEAYKDKAGNWQNVPTWHDIVIWREAAERAEKQLKKGDKVYIEGKITHRKYTDKEGVERYVTEIVANTFRSLESKEKGSNDNYPSEEHAPAAGGSQGAASSDDDDDLPF